MKADEAIPVFQVADMSAALRYYTRVLGFAEDFQADYYAGVRLGKACLHLCAHTTHQRPVGGGTASIFCDEVDLYCSEIKNRGAMIKVAPGNRSYGLRDLSRSIPTATI